MMSPKDAAPFTPLYLDHSPTVTLRNILITLCSPAGNIREAGHGAALKTPEYLLPADHKMHGTSPHPPEPRMVHRFYPF